jgi:NADP-dependent aldehyde dehydrogenase
MANHPVLIAGEWREAQSRRSFRSENPALGETLPGEYPISDWADCDAALAAATAAAAVLRASPPERIAAFLDAYAGRIEARKAELVDVAHAETGLPKAPRLAEVELPRTTGQLRQAAAAVAAASAASQSAQSLIGYSPGSFSPRAGFSALKARRDCALRHSPAMRTGWMAMPGS